MIRIELHYTDFETIMQAARATAELYDKRAKDDPEYWGEAANKIRKAMRSAGKNSKII